VLHRKGHPGRPATWVTELRSQVEAQMAKCAVPHAVPTGHDIAGQAGHGSWAQAALPSAADDASPCKETSSASSDTASR
jgi:hypothetical protein